MLSVFFHLVNTWAAHYVPGHRNPCEVIPAGRRTGAAGGVGVRGRP